MDKRAYRDDINPFLTEEGKDCRFDESAAPVTLDLLKRTVPLGIAWNASEAELEKFVRSL